MKSLKLAVIRAIFIQLSVLLILLLGLVVFFVATTPGTSTLFRIANIALPGSLKIHQLKGHLWHGFALESLTYQPKNAPPITLDNIRINWHVTSRYPLRIVFDEIEINQGRNHITLSGPLNGPLQLHANLPDLKTLHPSLAPLESQIIADATIYNMKEAILKATLAPGRYQLPKGNTPSHIAFERASLKAHLNPEGLKIDAYSAIDAHTTGRLNLNLPDITLSQPLKKNQAITGIAVVDIDGFDFLEELNQIESMDFIFQKPTGKLQARLNIKGTLPKPDLLGTLLLTEGKLNLPELGLILSPIEMRVKTNGNQWQANAIIQPNKGNPLTLTGNGTLKPDITGSLIASGENVLCMYTSEYQVYASPNLGFNMTPTGYDISGSVLNPNAYLAPVSFIHTQKLTHDAVFPETEKVDPNPMNLNTNIALKLGENVRINLKGIQGHVGGMLHIEQAPKQALTANGTLKLRDGRYEAYGQKLKIEQGELVFMGQQLDNPNLRVRAVREFKQTNLQFSGSNQLFDFSAENLDSPDLGTNTTVGITASGRADSPKVKLFSSPPNLSQADILSMLLLGKPVDQANKSGGQFLMRAVSAMHLDSGSKGVKMIKDLQKSTGIDFDVKNKSLGTDSSDYTKTSVTIGKSITKRVYLQYNVGLFQENSSVFTLTYLLNKFLSIKVTASDTGNGLDVTYSHSD